MKSLTTAVAIAAGLLAATTSSFAVTAGVGVGAFAGATVETFSAASVSASTYDFGNGMVHTNLSGQQDVINYTSGYGMGNAQSLSGGRDGPGTGYFGTGATPTTFEFAFAGGIAQFGFYGAESVVDGGSFGRNASMNISFYGAGNALLGTLEEATPEGVFAWDQFHGFASAAPIYRVVFNDAGHMVLDDVQFNAVAAIPEPQTYALLLAGLAAIGGVVRRRSRQL